MITKADKTPDHLLATLTAEQILTYVVDLRKRLAVAQAGENVMEKRVGNLWKSFLQEKEAKEKAQEVAHIRWEEITKLEAHKNRLREELSQLKQKHLDALNNASELSCELETAKEELAGVDERIARAEYEAVRHEAELLGMDGDSSTLEDESEFDRERNQ